MNEFRWMKIVGIFVAGWVGGCGEGAHNLRPGEASVVSIYVDYQDMQIWADTLTKRMLDDGFLDAPEYLPHPVKMVVSDIENKTDVSHFPTGMILGKIRVALRASRKVRYIGTYGKDGVDSMPVDTEELVNDPSFDRSQIPRPGQKSVAKLSFRTQILSTSSRSGRDRQNTYEVRVFVTDVRNGEVVWEGFSDPAIKKMTRAKVGW